MSRTPVLHVDGGQNIVRINRMATDDGLDCLDLLEETPAIVRGLIRGLWHDDARWKPVPDRFSVAEVLAHLSHSETQCYRMRVDRFLNEELHVSVGPETSNGDSGRGPRHRLLPTARVGFRTGNLQEHARQATGVSAVDANSRTTRN